VGKLVNLSMKNLSKLYYSIMTIRLVPIKCILYRLENKNIKNNSRFLLNYLKRRVRGGAVGDVRASNSRSIGEWSLQGLSMNGQN